MKRIEAFSYKILLITFISIIFLAILIRYATYLENKSRHLRGTKSDKINSSNILAYRKKYGQLSTKSLNKSIVVSQNLKMSLLADNKAECTFTAACTIDCHSGTLEETIVNINVLLGDNKCTDIALIIRNTISNNNSINYGWLKDITVGVRSLEIISIEVKELGESLFSGKPFSTYSSPLTLTLSNTPITILRKSTFTGSSILLLEINYDAMSQGIDIEEGVLGDTSSVIQSITLNNCLTSGEALKNLTGKGRILTGLQSLDFSYNYIPKLVNEMFSRTPNIKQLYLISSSISEIEFDAFQGLSHVMQLFLSGNNLKTLPENLFDDTISLLSLYISGNPWKCDCDMQWFKVYLNGMTQTDSKKCRTGSNWIDMDDLDFCPSNVSTTVTTPETSSTPSTVKSTTENVITTIQPKNSNFIYEKILCRNLLAYTADTVNANDKVVWYESMFKRRNIRYTFSEIGDSPTFMVNLLAEMKPRDFLIWTNVNNRSDYGCVFNITSDIFMDLQYKKTYTLCLSSNDTTDTYALIADDCTAIVTPPNWANRPWLLNQQKVTIIVSIVLTFIITVSVASGAIYYLVKYNPELIKGNKRVLIVKRGSYSPNVLVMPSKKDRHISLCTNDEGYLTPKLKHWIQKSKLSDLRYHELKTITDRSSVMENNYDEAMEKNIYEPIPPIPPNHPTKRRDSCKPYFYSNM